MNPYFDMDRCKQTLHVSNFDRFFHSVYTCSCKSVRQCLEIRKNKRTKKKSGVTDALVEMEYFY